MTVNFLKMLFLSMLCASMLTAMYEYDPVHEAVCVRDIELLGDLLDCGANPNVKIYMGGAPLHRAASSGGIEFNRLLLQSGADPNINGFLGSRPLCLAVMRGDIDIIRLHLLSGADPNINGHLNKTPLHWAVYNADIESLALLLANGADSNLIGLNSMTPLEHEKHNEISLKFIALYQQYLDAETYEAKVRRELPTTKLFRLKTINVTPSHLPAELWQVIGGHLAMNDLIALSRVNGAFSKTLLSVILKNTPIHIIIKYLMDNEPESLPKLNLPRILVR